jgi:hypothetical protein
MSATRASWRAWLLAAGFLLLGAAIGGAAVTMIGIRKFRQTLRDPSAGPGLAERAVERIGGELTQSLSLTPEQSARVKERLGASAVKLRGMRVDFTQQVREEIRSTLRDIARDLPADKRAEFRRLVIQRYAKLGLQPPPAMLEP